MGSSLCILIKPASGACNLGCRYCFYRDEAEHRAQYSHGRMTPDTARLLIGKAAEQVGKGGNLSFAFQGGEPTLRGLPFFQEFCRIADEICAPAGITLSFSIQTNGILVDEAFASFFAERKFLVGLSLDGYGELHDRNRVDLSDGPTHAKVLQTAALLKEKGVDFNILCVVTEAHAKLAKSLYSYFKKQGFRYLQFIPQIPPLGEKTGGISPAGYGRFLCDLFDAWYEDFIRGDYISIRDFDNLFGLLQGRPPELCSMVGRCSVALVCEADGSLYPCDFYVLDGYSIGNIRTEQPLGDLMKGEKAREFVSASLKHSPRCESCRWLGLCRTGCRRYKEPLGESDGLNYFCESYKRFFGHSFEKMKAVLDRIS